MEDKFLLNHRICVMQFVEEWHNCLPRGYSDGNTHRSLKLPVTLCIINFVGFSSLLGENLAYHYCFNLHFFNWQRLGIFSYINKLFQSPTLLWTTCLCPLLSFLLRYWTLFFISLKQHLFNGRNWSFLCHWWCKSSFLLGSFSFDFVYFAWAEMYVFQFI